MQNSHERGKKMKGKVAHGLVTAVALGLKAHHIMGGGGGEGIDIFRQNEPFILLLLLSN